jgi:hypothetical protein
MRHALSGGLALAAATLAAVPAGAETFTVLIYESPAELRLRDAGGDAGAAYWHAYAAFGQSLAEAGVMRGGAALAVPAKPTEVTLGGYFTIEIATRAEAEALAAKAPAVTRGGRVDVRSNVPTMASAR